LLSLVTVCRSLVSPECLVARSISLVDFVERSVGFAVLL
jgi:hypothetical protein